MTEIIYTIGLSPIQLMYSLESPKNKCEIERMNAHGFSNDHYLLT
jgi:hypothetical protein